MGGRGKGPVPQTPAPPEPMPAGASPATPAFAKVAQTPLGVPSDGASIGDRPQSPSPAPQGSPSLTLEAEKASAVEPNLAACADFQFDHTEALAMLSLVDGRPEDSGNGTAVILPGQAHGSSNNSTYEYDTVDLLEMTPHPDDAYFSYPCPCGDVFAVTHEELIDYEDIARCASCSLLLRVTDSSGIIDALREEAGVR